MRKYGHIILLVIGLTASAYAQIPNNGFEDWTTTTGSNENPEGWVTCNLTNNGHSVSKSTDHYPAGVGNYSVRMESDTAFINQSGCGQGFIKTALYLGDWGPAFPITGHPETFCGYYKFFPQNGDTMVISLFLFQGGTIVANAEYITTSAATDWTSFNLPISTYATADSAEIGISAFYGNYGEFPIGPWGNSVMYVDNISFDNLITSGISSNKMVDNMEMYPNPTADKVTISFSQHSGQKTSVSIYNIYGKEVYTHNIADTNAKETIDVSELKQGIYYVRALTEGNSFFEKKLTILR